MPARRHPLLALCLALLAVTAGACGDDGDDGGADGPADRAFLEAMIPHHESAIAMARIAKRRADHPQITELAHAIVTPQAREIRQIERIHQRLFDERVRPNEDAHPALGLSAKEAGMGYMDAAAELEEARPFDKAFIDEMIPHHEGAIRMAQAVRDETADDEIRSLARAIVTAQSNEIEAMKDWRDAWYGDPSPEPVEGEHEGH